MANGKINLGKQSGGVTTVTVADGASNTNLVLPESGTVATQAYADGKTTLAQVKAEISTGSNLVTSPTGVIGYGTGSGGLVTQSTSKSTAVTLNKSTGTIIMNNAALAAGASVQFDINNSLVGADDLVIITPDRSTDLGRYRLEHNATTGLINIKLTNIGPSTYSDAVVFNFAIIKGATV